MLTDYDSENDNLKKFCPHLHWQWHYRTILLTVVAK